MYLQDILFYPFFFCQHDKGHIRFWEKGIVKKQADLNFNSN